MAREKVFPTAEAALADLFEGAVVLLSGFPGRGAPEGLHQALLSSGVGNLTLVYSPGAWPGPGDAEYIVPRLVAAGRVRKLISPMPFYPGAGGVVETCWREGGLEIESLPQGILAERLRAGGAGLGGVFLPVDRGARFAEGKESRDFAGVNTVLELPLKGDFALLRAAAGDALGNLVYRGTDRNWGPAMAMAGRIAVAEVDRLLEPGGLDPELVVTPGIFVNRLVAGR